MNAYQRVLQKAFERNIPLFAYLELTYRCNLACVHCYATNRTLPAELSTSEIFSVLDQLREAGCLFLVLTGGEIFLRSDLFDILGRAREVGFATRLFTNGTLLTGELADKVAAIRPLSVELSLYALTPNTHDRITGVSGSHARTMSAISLCLERNLPVVIKTMLTQFNFGEYEALKEFVSLKGMRHVVDFVMAPTDDGSSPMLKYGLTERQLANFLAKQANADMLRPPYPPPDASLCGAGRDVLCVAPDGDVFPCLAIRKPIGNIRASSLNELWARGELALLRRLTFDDLTECRNCRYSYCCVRCPGIALAETGRIKAASSIACWAARVVDGVVWGKAATRRRRVSQRLTNQEAR